MLRAMAREQLTHRHTDTHSQTKPTASAPQHTAQVLEDERCRGELEVSITLMGVGVRAAGVRRGAHVSDACSETDMSRDEQDAAVCV